MDFFTNVCITECYNLVVAYKMKGIGARDINFEDNYVKNEGVVTCFLL